MTILSKLPSSSFNSCSSSLALILRRYPRPRQFFSASSSSQKPENIQEGKQSRYLDFGKINPFGALFQEYWNTETPGIYHCICCDTPLLESPLNLIVELGGLLTMSRQGTM